MLRHAVAALHEDGYPIAPLFRGMGFTQEALEVNPDFMVSYRQASAFLHRALRLVSNSKASFGLDVGRRRTAVSTGLVGLGMLASQNLHHASCLAASYPWAFGTLLGLQAGLNPDGALVITATPEFPDSELEPFLVEELFCSMTAIHRSLLEEPVKLLEIEFRHPPPTSSGKLRGFFDCLTKFERQTHRMVIAAESAKTVLLSADQMIRWSMVEVLDKSTMKQHASDICETISHALRDEVGNPPTLAQLSSVLNTSERTLRRKLSEQKTSYQQLLDSVRKDQALALLRSGDMSVSAVTAALGFSDVRNFRRAVKRWTGKAPSFVRKDA